jgi:transposase
MDGIEASSEGRQAADHGKRIRRHWTTAMKRRIVSEAEKPGAVRLEVAQRHGVHVSVLNRWRTELRSRSSSGKKSVRKARLLPIRVSTLQAARAASRPVRAAMAVTVGDVIEVAFPAGQRLTVRGAVDGGLLRTVLAELSRC